MRSEGEELQGVRGGRGFVDNDMLQSLVRKGVGCVLENEAWDWGWMEP